MCNIPYFQVLGQWSRALDSRTRKTKITRFFHRTTVSARKQRRFSGENVIPSSFSTRFCKNVVVSKRVKSTVAGLAFFDQQNGSFAKNN